MDVLFFTLFLPKNKHNMKTLLYFVIVLLGVTAFSQQKNMDHTH
jgi:hypothetical protein